MVSFSKLACVAATASAQRELFQAPAPANSGFLSQRTGAYASGYAYSDLAVPVAEQPLTYAAPIYAAPNGFEYAAHEPSQGWGWTALLGAVAAGALAGRTVGQYFSTDGSSTAVDSANVDFELAALAIAGSEARAAPRAAPKMQLKSKTANEFCFGLPGNIAPAGNFDPLNLLEGVSKEEVFRRREAELIHGRVAMLASLGFLTQESFHPLFGGNIEGPAINQIPEIPVPLWFIMTLGIGIAESTRIQLGWANPYEGKDNTQRLKPGYFPGDLGFDPLGLKPEDPAELRAMQERELSHGRLAMFAAAGFLAQETVTQQPWLATLAVAGRNAPKKAF
jgi:hypothetical protein